VRTAKNQLLELRRSPGRLILYLGVVALLVYVVATSADTSAEEGYSDILWVKGMAFVLFVFSIITTIIQGLSKGNTIFQMHDVNMLFVSPINPRSILIYGMSRMLKTAIISSIFIFFQSGWLRPSFGVTFNGVLIIYAAFVLVSAISPVLAVVIYNLTNSKPRRKTIVKAITVIAFAPMAVAALWHMQAADWDYAAGALALLESDVTSLTPVAGWAAAGAIAFLTGQLAAGLFYFGLLVLFGAILAIVIWIYNPDYYEDVLVATETQFEKQRTMEEGQVNTEAISDKRVHIRATGIKGLGASAFFYRHIREAFRASRFGLWGVSTPLIVIGAIAYAVLSAGEPADGDGIIFSLLVSLMVIQMFIVGLGRGMKDLYSHYIFMVPEKPLKKVVWSNLEIVFKTLVQNILAFTIAGIIAGAGVLMILAAIVACTLFSLVMIGVNYFYMRFTGANMRGGILLTVYFMTIVIVMLPGIAAAVVAVILIEGWGMLAALIILSVWELIAGMICFAASKGILHNCDMPTVRQFGL
jgi:hypothetical protein